MAEGGRVGPADGRHHRRARLAFSSLFGNANASGHIYLLKGLANVFSTGLDVLDQKLIQQGYSATVHSYLFYEDLAAEAARLQKSGQGPIIIMGHSSGADAAISMAEKMKTLGAPVALVVTFGPTIDLVAPSNVSRVINYYFGTAPVTKGPGFEARFPTWILVEPLISIISMLRRLIVSMSALSQRFRHL
jgi:hypothetical protein